MATGELWQVAWEEPGRPDGSPGGTWAAALERLVPWVVAAVPVSKEKITQYIVDNFGEGLQC